jgi:hypothetical protein
MRATEEMPHTDQAHPSDFDAQSFSPCGLRIVFGSDHFIPGSPTPANPYDGARCFARSAFQRARLSAGQYFARS